MVLGLPGSRRERIRDPMGRVTSQAYGFGHLENSRTEVQLRCGECGRLPRGVEPGVGVKTEEFVGGGRGIRTPERVTPLTVFKTAAFNHSAIPPKTMVADSAARGAAESARCRLER